MAPITITAIQIFSLRLLLCRERVGVVMEHVLAVGVVMEHVLGVGVVWNMY